MKTPHILLCLALLPLHSIAQENPTEPQPTIMDIVDWQIGPMTGDMGNESTIHVPHGYMFLDGKNTTKLMQMFGNIPSREERGLIAPVLATPTNNLAWFVVFDFNAMGYVDDTEKDELDPDTMLQSMIQDAEQSNKRRKKMGVDTMHPVGWALKPNYNQQSNNLEWALKFRAEPSGTFIINLNTRILGRKGVMEATLVIDPQTLQATIPTYQNVLTGYQYKDGQRYAEYRQGDRIAKIGLTGLIAGGGLAIAAKSGLLQKIIKPLLLGLLAIAAGIKKIFGFGNKEN